MARSLVALDAGKRYQAWLFWGYAALLLDPDSNIVEVGFEEPGVRAFDDIVVRRHPPLQESLIERIAVDHVQAKYHVRSDGAFTVAAMTDPAFIGAKSESLLHKLGQAFHGLGAEEFQRRRFWIVSPWHMDPSDRQLGELWRDNTSRFRLEVLRQGKRGSSQWFKLRALWREAVGVDNDEDLCAILDRLRIDPGRGGLKGKFAAGITNTLRSVGLKGIQAERAGELYSHIPWDLHGQGVTQYTGETLSRIATQYNLWHTRPPQPRSGRRLGIRTAVRWGDQMESTTDALLALEEHFDRRFILDEACWPALYAEVRSFLRDQVATGGRHLVEVGAITTVAFAAGYALPAKDCLSVYPLQRGSGGEDVWDETSPDSSQGGWKVGHDETVGDGSEIALGLAVSRRVWDDVRRFVAAQLPAVGRVMEIHPESGIGGRSIKGSGHALFLAEEAASFLRQARRDPTALAHLFVAAPNGLAFLLGQEGERLGRCQMYEFDLGGERTGSYQPSLLVPDHTR